LEKSEIQESRLNFSTVRGFSDPGEHHEKTYQIFFDLHDMEHVWALKPSEGGCGASP
jgi:hypothetical protein